MRIFVLVIIAVTVFTGRIKADDRSRSTMPNDYGWDGNGQMQSTFQGATCDLGPFGKFSDLLDCPPSILFGLDTSSNEKRKPKLFGSAELLILKYHRADGNRSGNYSLVPVVDTDDVDFRSQAAPRMTLGYLFDSGIGFRTRFFQYDADAPAVFFDSVDASANIKTFTIDMELFDRIRLGNRWAMELSGGIRYNEFKETMENYLPIAPIRENIFRGFGGVAGIEVQRALGSNAALYLRGRGSISTGDKMVNNGLDGEPNEAVILTNSIFGITEFGGGLQYSQSLFKNRAVMALRGGYEWQMWHNYSSAFSTITSTPNNLGLAPTFAGPSDVGFHGFTLGLEMTY